MTGTAAGDALLDLTTEGPVGQREEQELNASLAALSGLLSGHASLEPTLVRIAELTVAAVPGAEGAGLTLLEQSRQQTVVATATFVRDVDDVQYALGEGPCVSAVADGRPHTSGNLGGARDWPRFGPQAGRLGVHSALSLPLLLAGEVLGALNVYAHARDAFSARSLQLGEAFAGPAAVSVYNAQMLARAERLTGQLQTALASRAVIDQAMGVIMSRSGVGAQEAFDRLRAASQADSRKLSEVATDLVDSAVRQARARRGSGEDHPAAAGPEAAGPVAAGPAGGDPLP